MACPRPDAGPDAGAEMVHRSGVMAMRLLISLFSPPMPTYGGLTRGLAVADAARARGHQVVFAAAGSVAEALARRGERTVELPPATMLGLPPALSRGIARRSQNASLGRDGQSLGSIWLVLAMAGLARRRYLSALADAQVR